MNLRSFREVLAGVPSLLFAMGPQPALYGYHSSAGAPATDAAADSASPSPLGKLGDFARTVGYTSSGTKPQEGIVYQKDLGEKTAEVAAAMSEYNPLDGWRPVQ